MKFIVRILSAAVLMAGVSAPTHAAVVNLTFSGTYDTSGELIFGQSGAAVPYSFQITYNTALDTNTQFYATGADMGGLTTVHDWYGYSASGVMATNLTFGTQTWTSGDLSAAFVQSGISADLWFDTDISLTTPTLVLMYFQDSTGDILALGNGVGNGTIITLEPNSIVKDENSDIRASSYNLTISSYIVPEPATLFLFAAGLFATGRRKANGPDPDSRSPIAGPAGGLAGALPGIRHRCAGSGSTRCRAVSRK
jgi:hypothetical protein